MNKNFTYICDPKKNVNCPKDICKALGRGECMYTTDPKFALNPDMRIENNGSFEKKQTNQDKLAESIRTMAPERLAGILSGDSWETDIFNCDDCPVNDAHMCDEEITCRESIVRWLKEEIK